MFKFALCYVVLGLLIGNTAYADSADVPETGQTLCYDGITGNTVSCAGTGQDGDLKPGVAWPSPRFVVGAGADADCVTDNLTGLMWVKAPSDSGTRAGALTAANGLSLCGYSDWRLPNLAELESLYSAGVPDNTYADVATWLQDQGFGDLQGKDFYWTSTSYAADPAKAWAMNMLTGAVSAADKGSNTYYVWPVRGGD